MTWFEKMVDRHPYPLIFAAPALLVFLILAATLFELL